MASYRLTASAIEDLDRLYEFGILTFGIDLADRYYDGLVSHFQFIADNPLSYAKIDFIKLGYRRSPYQAHSVYYRLDENDVVIARILGRQAPTRAL